MNKNTERRIETKTLLTSAFWKLYKSKPITKITIKDITDLAGFYRSTFYFHFEDIYSILEMIEDNILNEWNEMVHKVLGEGNYDSMFTMISDFYKKNGEYMSVLLSPKGDPAFLHKIKEAMRPKAIPLFRLHYSEVESSLIFEFTISAILAFFTEWYHNSDKVPVEKAIRLLKYLASDNISSLIFDGTHKMKD